MNSGRERMDFTRPSFNREVHRLFVIASEGLKTEPGYFNAIKSEPWFNETTFYVECVQRNVTHGDPITVLNQLKKFKSEYHLKAGDELWMLIDRDKKSWTVAQIETAVAECSAHGFTLALSNPAFEFWLLLHHRAADSYPANELAELLENARTGKRTRVERELVAICGRYSKSNLHTEDYLPHVDRAIAFAKQLHSNPAESWPHSLGSHVYLLIEKLMKPSP